MAMLALCMPILPGKMEKWQAMINQVKSTPDFAQSRELAGVHERPLFKRPLQGTF